MSLTNDDLKAIKGIVDNAFEKSDIATAAGFAEVHEKIDGLQSDVGGLRTDVDELHTGVNRIESKLDPTIERADIHDVRITKLEKKLA